jgi:hypothetical protein
MARSSTSAARRGVDIRVAITSLLYNWLGFSVLIACISVYYLFLLSNGTFQLFVPELFSRAFDSMLVHLLHGQFNVDPDAIGVEAFRRDGKTYAYFGIFPAVLRLVAIPFTDVAKAEMARLSCLVAMVIFVALQLRMLLIVHNSLPETSRQPGLFAVMVTATVLSGPQLYLLAAAYIYHEPIFWVVAMGAAFNLIIVRAAFGTSGLRGRDLALLATLAGLAINTRPSVGAALCLGTVLLLSWAALQWHSPGYAEWPNLIRARGLLTATLPALTRDRRLLLPIAILGLLGTITGLVNFARWGNPFVFADFHFAPYNPLTQENALEVLRDYGEFNIGRLWIGALYYTTGIPYLLKSTPPFAQFLHARYQGILAPPVVPLLTNPITVVLAGVGLYRLWWKPDLPTRCLAILRLTLVAHASTVLLILTAMYLALRYHFDLAPFMTLAALVGYRAVAITAADAPELWRKRLYSTAVGLCVLGIIFSHYELVLHKVWCVGVPMEVRRALLPLSPVTPW